MRKSPAERSIEALTWASIVIWLGFMLVAGGLQQTWLVLMVLGIILLSSAIYQRSRHWETSLSIWIFGIWMAVFSVVETVNMLVGTLDEGAGLNIDLSVYLGIALVSMGVAGILRTVQGPRASSRRTEQEYTGAERDPRPRIVTDNFGAGHWSAPGTDAYSTSSRGGRAPDQTRYGTQARQGTPADPYGTPAPTDRYATYDQPTTYADSASRGYQEASQPVRGGYSYDTGGQPVQGGYSYDAGGQSPQVHDPYAAASDYDYYDEKDWDAPPQVQQRMVQREPPRQERRRARGDDAANDLQARVEDIIRRSRERRNISPDDMDLPY